MKKIINLKENRLLMVVGFTRRTDPIKKDQTHPKGSSHPKKDQLSHPRL